MSKLQKGTVARLLSYITKRHKKEFTFVVLCILISVSAAMIGSLFIQIIIDDYIWGMLETGENMFDGLFFVLVLMAIVYLLGAIGTLFYNRVIAIVGQKVLKEIRDDLFIKMQTLPLSYFDTHTHGDIMSVYTNDTDTLRQFIAQSLPMMISSLVTIVFSFCVMIYFNVVLAFIVLLLSLIMILTGRVMVKHSGAYFTKQQSSMGKVDGYIEEIFSGLKVVKIFCHEDAAKERLGELNSELYDNSLMAGGISMVMMPVMSAFGNLQYLIVAVVGGGMALFGTGIVTTTIGTLISFLSLVRQFSTSITQTAQQMNSAVLGIAGAGRIFELMDNESEKDNGYVTLVRVKEEKGELRECSHGGIYAWKETGDDGSVTYTQLQGNVVFDHVNFSYDGRKTVLHDISLYAKPGQKIALVGATGAGKTTITNLINRFYDLSEGTITYDGIDITKIKKADLRRSLGIVLQDVNLFTGTILDNIRYGRLEATDEECIAAAKLSGADDFIRRLPQGYQTVIVGDNNNLSQGQCQLLSIARAAVADPPVMILDEATSSIDTRTEELVQKGMDRLMQGRTVFVIAHRLSTVRNSQAIMVLSYGEIIERGSHEQLLAAKGQYYQLYTGAFELE